MYFCVFNYYQIIVELKFKNSYLKILLFREADEVNNFF